MPSSVKPHHVIAGLVLAIAVLLAATNRESLSNINPVAAAIASATTVE